MDPQHVKCNDLKTYCRIIDLVFCLKDANYATKAIAEMGTSL